LQWEFHVDHWVQLTKSRADALRQPRENGKPPRINKDHEGYQYADPTTGASMVEYHVDDIEDVQSLPELSNVPYGGFPSVRRDTSKRLQMHWGHDEACAHQKAFNSKCWRGHSGQQPLRPKDLGAADHISGFVNDLTGWNPRPTADELAEINRNRLGTKYVAEESAEKVLGKAEKKI
jgi:hypothetical protein